MQKRISPLMCTVAQIPQQKTNLLDRMIAENHLHFNASLIFADGDTLMIRISANANAS